MGKKKYGFQDYKAFEDFNNLQQSGEQSLQRVDEHLNEQRLFEEEQRKNEQEQADYIDEYRKQAGMGPIKPDDYQALYNAFEQDIAVEDAFKQLQDQEKYTPKNPIEEIVNTSTPDVYKNYKDLKEERDRLHLKTFGGFLDEVRRDNREDRERKYGSTDFYGEGITNADRRKWVAKRWDALGDFFIGGATVGLAGLFGATGDKLTKEEEQRYKELNRTLDEIERPVYETYQKEVDDKIKAIKDKYGIREKTGLEKFGTAITAGIGSDSGISLYTSDKISGQDLTNVIKSIDALEDSRDLWTNAIDNRTKGNFNQFWSGSTYNGDNFLSLGLRDTSREVGTALVARKLEQGEELSETEQLRLNSYKDLENAKGTAIDPDSWFSTGMATQESFGFIAEMTASMGTTNLVKGLLTNGGKNLAEKGIKRLLIKGLEGTIGQSMLMPSTYETAGTTFLDENLQRIEGADGETVLIANNAKRTEEAKKLNSTANTINERISYYEDLLRRGKLFPDTEASYKAELESLYNTRDQIQNQLAQITNEDGTVKENISALGAGFEGLRNTATEFLVEKYVGKWMDAKMMPAIGSRLGKVPGLDRIGQGYKNFSLKIGNQMRRSEAGTLTQAVWHSIKPGELIQSPIGEIGEEIVTQLVPTTYGNYHEQVDELSNPTFYRNILVSTLGLSGGRSVMQSIGSTADIRRMTPEEKSAYVEGLKVKGAAKTYYNKIDNMDDRQLAQDIAMNTYGTFFHPSDYVGRVSQLRDLNYNPGDGTTQEDRKKQADSIEKVGFINMALKAVQTDTQEDFKNTLNRQLAKSGVSDETKVNIRKALDKVDKYSNILHNNRNLVNRGTISNLEIDKDIIEESIADVNKQLQGLNLEDTWSELQSVYNQAGIALPENVTDLNSFFQQDRLGLMTSPVHLLQNENNIKAMDLLYARDVILPTALKETEDKLRYEKNPANVSDITKREKNFVEEQARQVEEEVKEEVIEEGLHNPEPVQMIIEEQDIPETSEPGDKISYGGATFTVNADGTMTDDTGAIIDEDLQNTIMSGANTDTDLDVLLPDGGVKQPTVEYNSYIEDAENSNQPTQQQDSNTLEEGLPDELMYPARIANQGPVLDSTKQKAQNYVNSVKSRIGKEPTFEDMIIDLIETGGYERTENNFNIHEKIFKSIGLETVNSGETYNKYFNAASIYDTDLELDQYAEQDSRTNYPSQTNAEVVNKEVEVQTIEQTLPEKKFKPEVDEVENENLNLDDRRTLNPSPKFAYNFQDIELTETGEYRIVSRSLKPIEDNDAIDNRFILDSDFMNKVRKEPNSLKAQIWDNPDQPMGKKSWGQLKQAAQKKFENNPQGYSDWFRDNVPVVITYTGTMSNNQPIPLSMVHSVSWYRPESISDRKGVDEQHKVIEEGKEKTRQIRQDVIDNGSVNINLKYNSENSYGQTHQIVPGTKPLTLNESNPDSTIALVESSGELRIGNKTYFDGIVVNKEQVLRDFKPGSLVHINQVGTNNNGTPIYNAFLALNDSPVAEQPNLRNNLNPQVFNNIKFAVLATTVLNNSTNSSLLSSLENNYGINISKANSIADSIKNSTGIDIRKGGLAEYTSLFTMVNHSQSTIGPGISGIINTPGKPDGLTYFNSNSDGSLGFVYKGNPTLNYKDVNKQLTVGQVPGETVYISTIMKHLSDLIDPEFGALHKVKMNVSFSNLSKMNGRELPMFDNNGNVAENRTLDSIYKDFLKTNIISHPIETIDGQTKYITDVQPMIYFETGTQEQQTQVDNINTEQQENIQTVTDIYGNTHNINSNDITVYQTEAGPIRYILDSNGNMVMLKEQPVNSQTIITDTQSKIDTINNLSNLTPEQKQIAIGIILGNIKGNSRFNSRLEASTFSSLETNRIDGLTNEEQKEISEALKNLIINEIDFSKEGLKYSDIKHEIENSVDKFISNQINVNNNIKQALMIVPGMQEVITEIDMVNQRLDKVIDQQEKLIGDNGTLINEFNTIFSTDFKEDVETIDENEENYSQSFLEKDVKLSYSAFLKMSFFGIPKDLVNGTNKTGFGFTNYHSADVVNGKLLDVTTRIPSNWNLLIDSLKDMGAKTKQSLYQNMVDRFENLPEHLRNELLYNTIGKKNTVWKVLNKPGKRVEVKDTEGNKYFTVANYNITILDENSSRDTRRMFNQIKSNFESSNLIKNIGGNLFSNVTKVKELHSKFQDAQKQRTLDVPTLRNLFNSVGIDVSNEAIDYIVEQTKNTPSAGIYGNSGIMTLLTKNLGLLAKSDNDISLEDFDLIEQSSGVIKNLVNVEVMLHKTFMGGSIYVGGKTMQAFISNTSIYDVNQKLSNTNDISYVELLRSIPYTSRNYVLELLQNNEQFRELYKEIGFSSPEAYKVDGRDVPDNSDFDKIAEQDNISTVLGLFMNLKGAELQDATLSNYPGLKFRRGQMPVHTISDKGRMVYLTTALLNLGKGDIEFSGNEVTVDKNVLEFIREQVFDSELDRIIQSYRQETNIVGYDTASKVFLLLPSLNNITIDTELGPVNIHDYLNKTFDGSNINDDILDQIKLKAEEKIQDYIQSETNSKLDSNGTTGIFSDLGFYDSTTKVVNNLNTEYIKKKPGIDNLEKLRFVAAEFAINNLIHNVTTQQLYLGDLAYYSKNKFVPTKTVDGRTIVDSSKISQPNIYGNMITQIGSNLQKRTALLIAPGKKIADSENILSSYAQNYIHLALNDVESMSSNMKELIESQYGLFDEVKNNTWNKIQYFRGKIEQFEGTDNPTEKRMIKAMQRQIKELVNSNFSDIADYFNITGTDAQEYTTWKTHLDMLLRQGKVTREQHDNFKNKIESEELTSDEMDVFLQPVKPVHTGMIYDDKLNIMRPIYIKASSFPLLPQMTKNLKIDGLRTSMENLEAKRGLPVQVSYQSANKIGALNTKLSSEDFYNNDLSTLENNGLLDSGLTVLPYSDYKIQQETPSKEAKFYKKGKDSHVVMGSQFFKILFGNFINHSTAPVFPNRFSKEILDMAGVEAPGNLSGQQLYSIYENIYFKYSDALKFQLETELGLEGKDFIDESIDNQNTIIKNLHKILEKEITNRNYPDYLKDSIQVIQENGKDVLESVLLFDNNRYKFESLIQAVISNRLITHTLPGNGHISASSNGFERKIELDNLTPEERQGITWINGIPKELKATVITREDGKKILQKSQVLIRPHWKYTDSSGNLKYVNLSDPQYTEDIVVDGKVVGKKLKTDMIDKELLEMFSYRIPTSSHQSGAIIEVAGFLPSTMQDLLVVPKEHTTQFGEDYDIDKRQVYKYNYYVSPHTGKIRKLSGEILSNKDEQVDNLMSAIFGDRYNEIKEFSSDYQEAEKQIKLLENALIDTYLSVYSTLDTNIQQKIYKPLVTDIADNVANAMQAYLDGDKDYTNFNILSDNYQRYLLKMGADGKGGIGVHSNAVTFEAQMQRLEPGDKINIDDYIEIPGGDFEMVHTPFVDSIGGYTFEGTLGSNSKTLDGGRDISDQHGENQNVSTDNISKQIMGKRNENSYTMSVYAFMAHLGFDLSRDTINANGVNIGKQHIPSLFINQPILRDYVKVRQKYESMTAPFTKDKEAAIIQELAKKYGFIFNSEDYLETTNIIDEAVYDKESSNMSGQKLFNNLKENIAMSDPTFQAAVLNKFLKYQRKSRPLSEVQQLINMSTSKLGVSYFEVLQRIEKLNSIASAQLNAESSGYSGNNFTKLIGDFSETAIEGYTKIGDYYWKPTTVEGKMLVNSLSVANSVLPIFFPYGSNTIDNTINSIFAVKGVDPFAKSNSNLKWKYEIMSEFVNFINSGSNIYGSNIESERKRLFFNSENNQALGNILKELRRTGHPIMQNSLLRDLTVKDVLTTGVVRIEHTPDEQTTLDKSTKYEDFKDLLKDDTIIGNFNGEDLRASDLAQDLISYSLLSNDMNGAIGFKNYIPIDFFKLTGDNANNRTLFNNILMNADSDELTALSNNFIRQYFQHHPERTVTLNETEFKLLQTNMKTGKPVRRPGFVSIRDTAKADNTKQYNLYEYNENSDSYSPISVLGDNSIFNEYNKNTDNQVSSLTVNQKSSKSNNQYQEGKTVLDVSSLDRVLQQADTIEKLFNLYANSPFVPANYKKLLNDIAPFIDKNTKVEFSDAINATYLDKKNVIVLGTKFYQNLYTNNGNDLTKAKNAATQAVIEEIIHSITVREVSKYVSSNAETGNIYLMPDPPVYIQNLVRAYNLAREKVPYNPNNKDATYGSKNFEEFIANVFTNPHYRASLENEQTGFIEGFLKVIRGMFRYLQQQATGVYPKYDDIIFSNVLELLKTEAVGENRGVEPSKKNILAEMKINNPLEENQRPLEKNNVSLTDGKINKEDLKC